MTYEMFFEAVKSHLKRYYFEDLPDYKLVEYMKSQEDVIQDQYDYWKWQVDENKEEATEESIAAMASGAAYSLDLLFEGQFRVLLKEVQIYVLFWQKKMVLQYMVVFICFMFLQDTATLYVLQMV